MYSNISRDKTVRIEKFEKQRFTSRSSLSSLYKRFTDKLKFHCKFFLYLKIEIFNKANDTNTQARTTRDTTLYTNSRERSLTHEASQHSHSNDIRNSHAVKYDRVDHPLVRELHQLREILIALSLN